MSGSFGYATVSLSATISTAQLATLASGARHLYVHAQGDVGGWGAVAVTVLNLDKTGPAVTGLTAVPNPTNGSVSVSLQGTASDAATGGQNVAAAEYTIDGGAATPISVTPASTVSLAATISAATVDALSSGSHTIAVRAKDAFDNWGATATTTLGLDKVAPSTGSVSVTPSPTNGQHGVQVGTGGGFYERIDATVTDGASTVVAAEYFIDSLGANGTGGRMLSVDGVFGSPSESVYAAVELSAIQALAQGPHTIYVHGKDAAGNWGDAATATLIVDKAAPTFTGFTLSPNPTLGATSVTLTVNGAADTGGAGITGGEYWICPATCTAPAPGAGTAFSGLTTTIPVGSLATGSYTVYVRLLDGAGNWSSGATGIRTATLLVVPDAIFSDGFESGNTSAWTSRSTNSATRLNVTAAAALAGSFGLQAQGSNTNYVQETFGTAANPATATYDVRFKVNANGNNSTGKDILSAATSNGFGTVLFRVRYRINGTQPQVQIQVGTSNANLVWTNLAAGSNTVEVVWQAVGSSGPAPGTLRLWVNSTAVAADQSLTVTSSAAVAAVRLGSVTGTGASTAMSFDAFVSKRSTTPLVGP